MLINFLGVRTASAAMPAAAAAAAGAMAGAAYAALGPLSLAELLPGGEDRRQDYGCHCYGVCHFAAPLPYAFGFGRGRNIAQSTNRSNAIATAVQTPKAPETKRRPSWKALSASR